MGLIQAVVGSVGGMLADMLASGMNAHVAFGDQAPVHIERQVITWLARMLGYESAEDLLALNLERDVYWDPSQREEMIRRFEPFGYANGVELIWKRSDGSPIHVQINAHGIRSSHGTLYFEGFVYDITEPSAPLFLGRIVPPRGKKASVGRGDWAQDWCTSHQLNFMPGSRRLVNAWFTGGVSVWDLTVPVAPRASVTR